MTKAAKKPTKPRGKTARGAAPLCRLVFVRPGTTAFRYGRWQPETEQLHSRVEKFSANPRQKFDVDIQVPAPTATPQPPIHTRAPDARAGQVVYRHLFPDGDTVDMDALTAERKRGDQLARYAKLLQEALSGCEIELKKFKSGRRPKES